MLNKSEHLAEAASFRSHRYVLPVVRAMSLLISIAVLVSYLRLHVHRSAAVASVMIIWGPLVFLFVRMVSSLTSAILLFSVPARVCPKITLSHGIPGGADVLIAMPCLLVNPEQALRGIGNLEQQYIANKDSRLRCALISDHEDSDEPNDHNVYAQRLLDLCVQEVYALNIKYAKMDGSEPFYLLHREQIFAARQERWMGWERKRGKIEELNELLTANPTSLRVLVGNVECIGRSRFVAVVDEDTRIYKGAIRYMLGMLLHPDNRPIFDGDGRYLQAGYGIVQPTLRSFCRCNLPACLTKDPVSVGYALALPPKRRRDLLHDMSGATTYRGKGLYNVDVFRRLLRKRLPDNTILSHDVVEGLIVRTAHAPVVFEQTCLHGFGTRASISHRWMRGNWQNLLFLVACRVSKASLKAGPYPFSWLLIHKCLRGVDEIAITLVLMGALLFSNVPTGLIFASVILCLEIVPIFEAVKTTCSVHDRRRMLWNVAGIILRQQKRTAKRLALGVVLAGLTAHAVTISFYRMLCGRHALDWTTSEKLKGTAAVRAERHAQWFSVLICTVLLTLNALQHGSCIPIGLLCFTWCIGSFVVLPTLDGPIDGGCI